MTSGVSTSKEVPLQREKKLVDAYVVKSGMLRFNFMLDCCNPGTLPDAHLVAALLDLVSIYTVIQKKRWRSIFDYNFDIS